LVQNCTLRKTLKDFQKGFFLFFPLQGIIIIGDFQFIGNFGFLNLYKGRFQLQRDTSVCIKEKLGVREEADRALFWAWKAGQNHPFLEP